jgi:hypothetical protein
MTDNDDYDDDTNRMEKVYVQLPKRHSFTTYFRKRRTVTVRSMNQTVKNYEANVFAALVFNRFTQVAYQSIVKPLFLGVHPVEELPSLWLEKC